MKKIIALVSFLMIALVNFGQTLNKSLNGYLQTDVKTMIAPFNKIGTQPPQITSVWFDKSIIINMVALLNQEVTQKKNTDGIRVYFAQVGNKETVVIVSTKDSGLPNSNSPEQDNFHNDYYDHSSSAALFTMQRPISGEPCYDMSCKDVTLLYGTSGAKDTCQYTADNPHYLSRYECENMVHAFASQKTNINTRGEWFDLKLLNAIADLFKNEPFIDGIRIYFARHTNNGDTPYGDYVDEDAFVIVPTQTVPNSNPIISRQDYFDCALANYRTTLPVNRLRKTKIQLKNNKTKIILETFSFQFKASPNGGGQDNGELCPFNCTN